MDALDLHAPFCHHIGRHRGVDAAGEQHHGPSAHACGQTAGAGFGGTVDVGHLIPYFDIDRVFRVVDVHLQVGIGLGDAAADLLGDLDGVEREALVRPLGFHLEAFGGQQVVVQKFLNGCKYGIQVLHAGAAAAQGHHAEDVVAGVPGPVHVTVVALGLHKHRGLDDADPELAEGPHPAVDVLLELVFKLPAVLSLQDDLAQLEQKMFVHIFTPNGHQD